MTISGYNNRIFGAIGDSNKKHFDVGWSWSNGDGAGSWFGSSDYGSEAGFFGLFARSSTSSSKELIGRPNGSLTWNGNEVITAGNISSHIGSVPGSEYVFNSGDLPQNSNNIASYNTAHKMTFYRNAIMMPYQMDNANDGGFIRSRGTSEDSAIFEIGMWDDSGAGETIQFNYYPTTSTISPTYSISVPKKSGTIALTSDINSSVSWSNVTNRMNSSDIQSLNYLNGSSSDYPRLCLHIPNVNWANISVDTNANFHFRQSNSASGSYTNIYLANAYASSDRHLKKNIQDIDKQSLDDLYSVCNKLFKKFTWKSSNKGSYGLIAQAIEKYIPEAISYNNEGIMSINYEVAYAKLFATLIHKIYQLEHQEKDK